MQQKQAGEGGEKFTDLHMMEKLKAGRKPSRLR